MARHDRQFAEHVEALKRALTNIESLAQQQGDQGAAADTEASELGAALLIVRRWLREHADRQPELAASVARVARWLLETVEGADERQPHYEPSSKDAAKSPRAAAVTEADERAQPPAGPGYEVPLQLGDAATVIAVRGTHAEAEAARQSIDRARSSQNAPQEPASTHRTAAVVQPEYIDLELVAKRCAVKAEGWDWAARYRAEWVENPPDQELRKATYDRIISKAKALPNCYVWALNPEEHVPDFERMTQYAQAFRNLGSAVELALSIRNDASVGNDRRMDIYELMAEAQSALRSALEQDGFWSDNDQFEVFRWLRHRASQDRFNIARHMRLDDPADIASGEDLASRLNTLRHRLTTDRQIESERRSLLNKAKYHIRQAMERGDDEADAHWLKVIESVETAIEKGVRPTSVELREILLPVVDDVPKSLDWPTGFAQAMEATDQFAAMKESEEAEVEITPRAPAPEVTEASSLLEGQVVVLIGGEVRGESKRALERALKLAELRWIPGAHHQSHYLFESAIARPDTVVVLLAIRWASHSFENVDELCTKYGKLFVRLPGGYSPNQVARQILDQVGEALRARRARSSVT